MGHTKNVEFFESVEVFFINFLLSRSSLFCLPKRIGCVWRKLHTKFGHKWLSFSFVCMQYVIFCHYSYTQKSSITEWMQANFFSSQLCYQLDTSNYQIAHVDCTVDFSVLKSTVQSRLKLWNTNCKMEANSVCLKETRFKVF